MNLEILKELNAARRERRGVVLVTDTETSVARLVRQDEVAGDELAEELQKRLLSGRSGMMADGRTFLTV